jgi:hypothetical protein
MSALQAPPEYLHLKADERGEGLGISWDDYRALARTALKVIKDIPYEMGIYRWPEGAALDIWSGDRCLTIQINSAAKELSLFRAEMDGAGVICLLTVSNSEEDWRELGRIARREILQ